MRMECRAIIQYFLLRQGRKVFLSLPLKNNQCHKHLSTQVNTGYLRLAKSNANNGNLNQKSSNITSSFGSQQLLSKSRLYHGYQLRRYCTGQTVDPHSAEKKLSSALYVRRDDTTTVSAVDVDLNLDAVYTDVEGLTNNIHRRGLGKSYDLDTLTSKYKRFSTMKAEHEKLEIEREKIAEDMKFLVKKKKKYPDSEERKKTLITQGKQVREKLKHIQTELWELEAEVMLASLRLPNTLSSLMPDEDDTEEEFGALTAESGAVLYKDIGRDLVTFSNLSQGAYFLHGSLARLELDLVDKMSRSLRGAGLLPFACPDMTKALITEGCGGDLQDRTDVLTLQLKAADLEAHHTRGGDQNRVDKWDIMLNLCGGAALAPLAGFLCRMNIASSSLPQKWFSIGRHYRPGSALSTAPSGLLGVTQATQVSVFGVAKNDTEAKELLDNFVESLWDFYTDFGIPIRLVNVGAPGLLKCESFAKHIEAWLPSEQRYIKIAGIGLYNDFISRRLMVKWSDDVNNVYNKNYAHMVYGTALDFPRLAAVLFEMGLHNKLKLCN